MVWDPDGWIAPQAKVVPATGECHVWFVRAASPEPWAALLSSVERAQVGAFRLESSRRMFITSRATQRLVVAHYSGIDATAVKIDRSCEHCGDPRHGRPAVADAPIDYSVSHSGDWLVMAVVGDGRVGVDLEEPRNISDLDGLASATFSPAEYAEFRGGAAVDFYRTWTRKESVVKLTGRGLAAKLSDVDVRGGRVDGIYLTELSVPGGYAGALASSVELHTIRFCRLNWRF
jgi:4'-phosphopantetheinyl transferase